MATPVVANGGGLDRGAQQFFVFATFFIGAQTHPLVPILNGVHNTSRVQKALGLCSFLFGRLR